MPTNRLGFLQPDVADAVKGFFRATGPFSTVNDPWIGGGLPLR